MSPHARALDDQYRIEIGIWTWNFVNFFGGKHLGANLLRALVYAECFVEEVRTRR